MAEIQRKGPYIRRIVTGHDAAGKAVVWRDGLAGNHKFPDESVSSTLMWVTDETPADLLGEDDAGERIIGTAPPAGGTRFTVMEIAPGNTLHGLHRTDTIDYVICIAGEIAMRLDDSTVTMKAGDIMIQRGTNHGWINPGTVPARIAVVLIDGKPKRAGSVTGSRNAR
jgi:quercetin dioxygenase-like cupin family protein